MDISIIYKEGFFEDAAWQHAKKPSLYNADYTIYPIKSSHAEAQLLHKAVRLYSG